MNKNMMIIGGMVLATIIAFLLINFLSGSKGTDDREVIQELTREIADLESSILDLEVILVDTDKQLDTKKQLLDEKYDIINKLSDKVTELERSGKVDKAKIASLRQQLMEAKNKVADASQIKEFKQQIDQLVVDISYQTQYRDSIEIEMNKRDSLANALIVQVETLKGEIEDCGQSNAITSRAGDETSTNSDSSDNNEDTENDWEGYRATNFKFYKNNDTRPSKLIGRKGLSQVKVQFDFEGRKVPNGNKEFYLVFQNFVTKKVFTSNSSRSETFNAGGKEITYTALLKLENYQGGISTLVRPVIQDSDGQLGPGAWDAFVYCEGDMIGKQRIVIQQ